MYSLIYFPLAPCKKPIEFLKSLDLCGRLLKIMVGKVSLRCNCRGKTLLGIVNKLCLITSSKLNCLTELCNQGDATFYMLRLKVGQTVSMFNMLHKNAQNYLDKWVDIILHFGKINCVTLCFNNCLLSVFCRSEQLRIYFILYFLINQANL